MVRLTLIVVLVVLGALPAAAQGRGYLAIDEQGGRHALSFGGEADAVNMCGTAGCEVVASFASCPGVAYSSPAQGPAVWAWLEAATQAAARVGALGECESACGPACEVLSVSCVDAPAVEAALGLDDATRRRIQQGLGAAGFDAGRPDGVFGPRTRRAIVAAMVPQADPERVFAFQAPARRAARRHGQPAGNGRDGRPGPRRRGAAGSGAASVAAATDRVCHAGRVRARHGRARDAGLRGPRLREAALQARRRGRHVGSRP